MSDSVAERGRFLMWMEKLLERSRLMGRGRGGRTGEGKGEEDFVEDFFDQRLFFVLMTADSSRERLSFLLPR